MNDVDERIERYAARWQREADLPEARFAAPGRTWRRLTAGSVAAVTAAIAIAAGTAAVVLRDRTDSRPAENTVAAPDVDRYDPRAEAFFREYAPGSGATEAEHFASLSDAYGSATVVLLAEVTDVRPTRTVPAGSPDAVTYTGVVLRPVEVLRGELRGSGPVVVEFAGPTDAAAPGGFGVWLLRNKGDVPFGAAPKPGAPANDESAYYRLVSTQGLFVQGRTHVVNPVRERATPEIGAPSSDPEANGPRDPVAREAESFATVSALVAHLRSMR